jgi:predicted Zn-dependent peptidase
LLAAAGLLFSCSGQKYETVSKTDANGFAYEEVTNDPMKTRVYTLENGLKVYLSINKDEPRISTLIGVRAGSASDPVETTGLAHYFEHMMFKGTDEIGTINWEAEKPLLDEIENLFEQHRSTNDAAVKKQIYQKIDSLSAIAATYVATNEYDKMVSGIGAKRTNAGTSYDYTVYINDIPKNELHKWLMLESERFNDIVLRLFHTELETVYEEYNMYQDMDRSRANSAMMAALFPNHPYGRQIIGLAEHIKNPSMTNIYEFAETFYVPNNMAIALAGDLDFEETIMQVNDYFGKLEPGDIPEIIQPEEQPLDGPIVKEVYGPDAENMMLAFRFDGDYSYDDKMVSMIDMILSNSQAGLIDLNLNQQQKVLRAGSYANFMKDYGMHVFYGSPREGQTLEEVKDLLLAELEKVKNGEFEEWMLEAIINDMRLSEIYRNENNFSRAFTFVDAFIKEVSLEQRLKYIDEMEMITKAELVEFANKHYADNYVVVYKRFGESTNIAKVDKPELTAVPINREYQSAFYKEMVSMESESIDPVFLNYDEQIDQKELKPGVDMYYIQNKNNEIFNLYYIIDIGKDHNIKFPLAVDYLPYLGTDKYTPAELQQEFFRLGLSFGVNTGGDRSYVYISGLSKSYEKAIELLEHVVANAKADEKSYADYVDGILKQRDDSKKNKNSILYGGMMNYGIYGENSSFRNILTEEELRSIDPASLTDMIASMTTYEHKIFYYGPDEFDRAAKVVSEKHSIPETLAELPPEKEYIQIDNTSNEVYIVDYDITQANILMVSKSVPFSKELIPPSRVFGEYFGGGLSSIIFQEIRESRALAYSAFSAYSIAGKPDKNNVVYGFVGTQADKLEIATTAMLDLMNNMPEAEKQFNLAKESIIKKINTERITKSSIFWNYLGSKEQGIDYDIRKDVYDYAQNVSMEAFRDDFFNRYISGLNYNFMILGKKDDLDMKSLAKIGKVHELSLEEIFNY